MPQPHLSLTFNPSTIVTNQTGLHTRYAWKWHDVEQFLFIYFSLSFFFGLLMILCFFYYYYLSRVSWIFCAFLFFLFGIFFLSFFFYYFSKSVLFTCTIFRGANRKYYFCECLNRIRCFISTSFYSINYLWNVFIIYTIVFSFFFCDRGYKLT